MNFTTATPVELASLRALGGVARCLQCDFIGAGRAQLRKSLTLAKGAK